MAPGWRCVQRMDSLCLSGLPPKPKFTTLLQLTYSPHLSLLHSLGTWCFWLFALALSQRFLLSPRAQSHAFALSRQSFTLTSTHLASQNATPIPRLLTTAWNPQSKVDWYFPLIYSTGFFGRVSLAPIGTFFPTTTTGFEQNLNFNYHTTFSPIAGEPLRLALAIVNALRCTLLTEVYIFSGGSHSNPTVFLFSVP